MGRPSEVVVIAGASGGVGRATAIEFGKRGAMVALLARGRAGLEGALRDVEVAGGRGLLLETDVADSEQVEAAASRVEAELGPIDVWVNDAMVTVFSEFTEIAPEEYRRVTDVTYHGQVNGTRAALRRMLPRDRGTIVQVGSALAYRGIPLQSAYCGAKHAVRGFTASVRTELLHRKSRVWITMVQLPAMNTPQFSWCMTRMPRRPQPVPPIYQPEVAARAIHFAAHHRRREMYVGGITVAVVIGNKIAPALADRYLARTGYASQQYDGSPGARRVNLWEPADSDHDFGAHGEFAARAHRHSPQAWLSAHKWQAGAVLSLAAAAAAGAGVLRGRSSRGGLLCTLRRVVQVGRSR